MLPVRPLRNLLSLFGFGKGQPPRARHGQSDVLNVEFGSAIGQAVQQWYDNNMSLAVDRRQRYREMDAIDQNDILCSALDLYTEDALRSDQATGRTIWAVSRNRDIERIANHLMVQTCRLEEQGEHIVRSMCKYGDRFMSCLQMVNDKDVAVRIGGLRVVQPYWVSKEQDPLGRVSGYILGYEGNDSDPGHRWPIPKTETMESLMPWEMVHFMLPGQDDSGIYGTSILFAARRVFRRLNMMEEALTIHRIKKAPDRYKWKVPTGGAPPDEQQEILNEFKQRMNKAYLFDKDTGEMKQELAPWSLDDDIYLAVAEDMQADCELLKGSGVIGNITDVEYMRNRLFSCIRIPPDFLGFAESGGSLNQTTPLSEQSIRYSHTVKKVQKAYATGVTQLVKIDMVMRGIDPDDERNKFTIRMSPVSHLEEKQAAETAKVRADIVSELLRAGKELGVNKQRWHDYVGKLSGFPEEIVDLLKSSETSESKITEATQKLARHMMDTLSGGTVIHSGNLPLWFDMPTRERIVERVQEVSYINEKLKNQSVKIIEEGIADGR